VSVACDGSGTLALAALLSLAELVCRADVVFFETAAEPLLRASPLVLEIFLLGVFLGMDLLQRFSKGIWMLSAHRQREDHSDLHRWHNNVFYFNK
jgi:hypothetical protein